MSLNRSLAVLSLLLAPPAAIVLEPQAPDDEARIRAQIELFLADPTSETGSDAASAIAVYVNESKAVDVQISTKVCVWVLSGAEQDTKEKLLAAFMAGNVRSQLDTGTKRDDSYSGIVQALRVYRALKAQNPSLKEAGMERFATMQAKGELNQHILDLRAEAVGKPTKDEQPAKDKKKP
jgi:hypothetical protein